MTGLETKLNAILNDKLTNLTPENLKKGVTCLGVTGTLEASASSGGIKQFSTVEEMNSSTGNTEGDLAVVYIDQLADLIIGNSYTEIYCPKTITFTTAITGTNNILFASGTTTMSPFVEVNASYIRFYAGSFMAMNTVRYTSSDGITYTRDDDNFGEIVSVADIFQNQYTTITIQSDKYNILQQMFKVKSVYFGGLYKYNGTAWDLAPTDLTTVADEVYLTKFYGKNGVETGTLTTSVSNSFADTNAAVYGNIQQAYDSMTPRVLTNTDKDIDKNIYFIPTKTDGTILLDTSNVTDMTSMFDGCTNLITIPLLDTSNVTNMSHMLRGCTNLTTIPSLNTSSATNMTCMFDGCTNLTTIPQLDTNKVTDMSYMFDGCTNLTTIPQLDTNKVTDMTCMLDGCTNLTTIPLLNTSNVTDMGSTFHDCNNLTTIPQLDTNKVTSMSSMFSGCTNLQTIPQLDTSSVTNMAGMFDRCTNLQTIPLLDTSSATNMLQMFSYCSNLQTIPLLDTSSATSMAHMFNNCQSLTTIPLLDTSAATNIYNMLGGCTSLSDDSLNNVLAMCTNATKITSNKTLKNIGLTSDQATKCATLSNYSAFTAAGWTTGY